jgi:hypothetical protein
LDRPRKSFPFYRLLFSVICICSATQFQPPIDPYQGWTSRAMHLYHHHMIVFFYLAGSYGTSIDPQDPVSFFLLFRFFFTSVDVTRLVFLENRPFLSISKTKTRLGDLYHQQGRRGRDIDMGFFPIQRYPTFQFFMQRHAMARGGGKWMVRRDVEGERIPLRRTRLSASKRDPYGNVFRVWLFLRRTWVLRVQKGALLGNNNAGNNGIL